MRTCNETTKAQIMALDPKTIKHPPHDAWVVAAVWDALHDRPMSVKRERRLRLALGLEASPRRRYCRLCLPVTLTQEQRQQVRTYALEIAGPVPGAEVT